MKLRDQEMMETFLVAIHCWDFLQSNVTYRGGMCVCVRVHMLYGCMDIDIHDKKKPILQFLMSIIF